MNSSEQKETAVPDCNQLQNEQKAAAQTSHLIAELKKSIKKPVRWIQPVEPYQREQEFFIEPKAEYVKALGYNTAILITYLLFRYQPDKDTGKPRLDTQRNGMFYWAETHDDMLARIKESVPYTKDKLRAAIKKAEDMQILEAKPMRYSGKLRIYKGETVTHYRLAIANGAAALSNWPTAEAVMRMTLGWDFSIPIGWDFPNPKRKEKEGKEEGKKKQKRAASLSLLDQGEQPLTPPLKSGKSKPQTPVLGKEPAPYKAKGKPEHGYAYAALAERHDMPALLALCIKGRLVPHKCARLTDKACKYLYPLARELEKDGRETLETFIEAITASWRNWDTFCSVAEEIAGKDLTPPARPSLLFLKAHAHAIITMMDRVQTQPVEAPPTAPAPAQQASKPTPLPKVNPTFTKPAMDPSMYPTKEQLLADIAKLHAVSKA